MLQFSVTIVAFAALFTLAVIENTQAVEWDTGFTTDNLEKLFTDKCIDFGKLDRTHEIYDKTKFNHEGCEQIWSKFIGVIDKKDKVAVRQGYRNFFKYIEDHFYKHGFQKEDYFENRVRFFFFTYVLKFLK